MPDPKDQISDLVRTAAWLVDDPSLAPSLLFAPIDAASEALATVVPGCEVDACPMADGGEGTLDAVEAAAKEHGVRRTRRLVVAGAFHSECMRPAAERLAVLAGLMMVEAETP